MGVRGLHGLHGLQAPASTFGREELFRAQVAFWHQSAVPLRANCHRDSLGGGGTSSFALRSADIARVMSKAVLLRPDRSLRNPSPQVCVTSLSSSWRDRLFGDEEPHLSTEFGRLGLAGSASPRSLPLSKRRGGSMGEDAGGFKPKHLSMSLEAGVLDCSAPVSCERAS